MYFQMDTESWKVLDTVTPNAIYCYFNIENEFQKIHFQRNALHTKDKVLIR